MIEDSEFSVDVAEESVQVPETSQGAEPSVCVTPDSAQLPTATECPEFLVGAAEDSALLPEEVAGPEAQRLVKRSPYLTAPPGHREDARDIALAWTNARTMPKVCVYLFLSRSAR